MCTKLFRLVELLFVVTIVVVGGGGEGRGRGGEGRGGGGGVFLTCFSFL